LRRLTPRQHLLSHKQLHHKSIAVYKPASDFLSRQANQPGFSHDEVGVLVLLVGWVDDGVELVVVAVLSLHPSHPGVLHEEVLPLLVLVGEAVKEGGFVMVGVCRVVVEDEDEELLVVVVVLSLHPNHPGVLQVDVVVGAEVLVVETFDVAVAGSSRQPHQPGVWQVSVLVLVTRDVDVGF